MTLPTRAARSAGLRLLVDNAGWVGSKLLALPPALLFAAGSEVPIGGVPHRIHPAPDGHGGAWVEGAEIRVAGDRRSYPGG